MASVRWKGIEREIAAIIEGKRVPSSGNGAIKGDVVQARLVPDAIVEAKHGQQVLKAGPKALTGWLAEAERDADTACTAGAVLVLHAPRVRVVDSLAVMRLGVLANAQRRLRGELRPGEEG